METNQNIQKELIESIGVIYERAGHTPMAGRVAGLLFLAEPPYKSFEQLVSELSASKSAVSNALNVLLAMGLIDYITFHGDRKRYFRINVTGLDAILKKEIDNIKNLSELLNKVINNRSGQDTEFNEGIKNFICLLDIFYEEYPAIIEKWKNLKTDK
jgi:DNA-binding transcriptional regulator GbsR (MarR family)